MTRALDPDHDDVSLPLRPASPERSEIEPWHVLYEGDRPAGGEQTRERLAARPGYDLASSSFVAEGAIVVADRLRLGSYAAIAAGAVVRGDATMGAHSTLNPGAQLIGRVEIGEGVRIAANTVVVGESHIHDDVEVPIWLQGITSRGVVIEDGVWIGANSTIVDGVRIGAHSIVGAGSTVTHDVAPFTIVGGVPARPIDDRRRRAATARSRDALARIDALAREQVTELLERRADGDLIRDRPGSEPHDPRARNDAVELAAMVGALDVLGPASALIERIQRAQDPTTGLFVDPRHGPARLPLDPKGHEWEMYGIESCGCALEVLGAGPRHPIHVIAALSADDVIARLDALDQSWLAWPSGAWIDAFATGARLNVAHHHTADATIPLWGWLRAHQDPESGVWGRRLDGDTGPLGGWLMAVNGFYRAARGTYASFGVAVPRPERVIDTVLELSLIHI